MSFRARQKVVCVDDRPSPIWGSLPLKNGVVYTVRRFEKWKRKIWGIELYEVDSPHPSNLYNSRRFRPAVEHKTDISIFKKMLTPTKEPAL